MSPDEPTMTAPFLREDASARPIWFVDRANLDDVRKLVGERGRSHMEAAGFEPSAGRTLLLPLDDGLGALLGLGGDPVNPFLPGLLAGALPGGAWRFANEPPDARLGALAFALGAYRFARYRKAKGETPRLVLPQSLDLDELTRVVAAVTLARDLINTPTNDCGPADLEAAARTSADRYGARVDSTIGDDLLAGNFPLIHAVGRAAAPDRAPRLIDLNWDGSNGDPTAPKITIVGKGVCFDTGGLDLKPDSAMLLMKKDMGGAAATLALAQMIMDRGLPVRLRALVPAVENSVAGNAFRPMDIYRARNGLTVEVGNTDAEGRLILADALALACEDKPDLLIDMGTLTGAARVALGPELPPFYTDDEALAADVSRHAMAENDPLWRLPLWPRYEAMLDSKTADLNNVATGGMAGSIICALFLKRFVTPGTRWLHLDIYGWTPAAKPGRPEGGECQAARALYALLSERFG